ncbi:hypothetical protein PBY51_005530 [Eleginops maclovinus]|uniref:Uncharacterized protein n=1 Tax=Eleginops maclovinus TaxID=56733 RepID=A0AAN7X7K3_ELEMC|nr:hypothetical protein PBY51_005530 [Eleginops maclovinus]
MPVLVLAFISPLDSRGSCGRAETALCKQLHQRSPECKAGRRVGPLAVHSQAHYICGVESPDGSRLSAASGAKGANLHLTVWLTPLIIIKRSFPQQNHIAAFDPTPKLIYVHFWGSVTQ